MLGRIASICLVLLAAAPAWAEELKVVPMPWDEGEVPAGTREDQLLWRDTRDAVVDGMSVIGAANRALYDLRYAKLDLDEIEKVGKGEDLARTKALREKLAGPERALDAAIPRGPTGRCRYTVLHLQQSMQAPPDTDPAKRLPEKRAEATSCRDEFRGVVATLGPAVATMRKTIDEVAPEIRLRLAHVQKVEPTSTQSSTATSSSTPTATR